MEAIYIPQLLKMPEHKQEFVLDDSVAGLHTLTPVRGLLTVAHRGNFLEVELQAETILTLTCDRCLQTFNHRLSVETSEIIWLDSHADLDSNLPLERELSAEDLSESLPVDGYFEVAGWLYEQLSLAMPMRRLCGKDCQAPPTESEGNRIDGRWASLVSLKSMIKE